MELTDLERDFLRRLLGESWIAGCAPAQSRGAAIATSNNYFIAEERCRIHADESSAKEVKQVWLSLAETYRALVALDQVQNGGAMICGKRLDTPEAV